MGPIDSRVQAHPGVATAHVTRRLPGTLVITITEHQPIAFVPGPQGFRVFDARGVALPIDPSRVTVDAPVIARADTALLRLLAGLRADLPALYRRVSEVKRVGTNELMFELAEGPVRALSSVTVEDLHQVQFVEEDLRKRSARLAELDLRYSGQIIARLQ
jgi:cell division septal protein FtsQ